jgi:pilus assembly protein CpaB
MGRRTILLVLAAVVAVLGAGMVYLYVQGADDRAMADQAPVSVLTAVAQIEPGETLAEAQAAGKLQLSEVPAEQVLDGALVEVGDMGDQIALQRVFVGEQVTASKFGSSGEQDVLAMPKGKVAISINLTDTGRVAGFVSPGSKVALYYSGTLPPGGNDGVRVLLPEVEVIAVGQTTVTTSTTTTAEGEQTTTEQLPRTLFTLAVTQEEAEKVIYASTRGELTFAYKNDDSKVKPGNGVTSQNLFG